ncbi:unnamed protein product [Peniophora sp. CBMAI 1063]|nr:unnamed protein product [Peniophora sp. CBMAI 1063]
MTHTVYDHNKITLGPGFVVKNVTTPNEASSLVIGNLPLATAREPLTRLIESFGGTILDMQIPDRSTVNSGESMSVGIRMSSHLEAVTVANGLDGVVALHCSNTLSVRPADNHVRTQSQVSSAGLYISWKVPTVNVYAGFRSLKAARRVVALADGYDWDGFWITASIYDGFPVIGEHNVRFSGLPPDVKLNQVTRRFRCPKVDLNIDNRPRLLPNFGIPQVLKRVSEFGDVDHHSATRPPYKDDVVRVWCWFKNPDVAYVARELNGVPQRSLGGLRLAVRRIYSLRYAIARRVYNFIRDDIEEFRQASQRIRRGCNIRLLDRDERQGSILVEVSSTDDRSLQEIKSRLADIAQGEVLMDGSVPLWDRFFTTPFGADWMNTVRKATPNTLVVIRRAQSCIRVIGAPNKRAAVLTAVRDFVATMRRKPIYTIPLPGIQFGVFMHPALLEAREKHGSSSLWLDLPHRQLCLRGDEAMYEDVQAAVHIATKAHSHHLPQYRCPVCFHTPTSAILLPCGDTYCKECLTSYLAAGTEARQFPLTCFGSSGECKEPIPLVSARDILSPTQWEELVISAFNAYITTKPDEFRFCLSPDCRLVYRPGAKDSIYTCPACLIRICSFCDVEYHEGIACDDRIHGLDSAFDEYVRIHDVKQCPGCKAPIERVEGCGHITCTRCHTHTCWKCMETFDKGVGIYDHMREAHGSIGV